MVIDEPSPHFQIPSSFVFLEPIQISPLPPAVIICFLQGTSRKTYDVRFGLCKRKITELTIWWVPLTYSRFFWCNEFVYFLSFLVDQMPWSSSNRGSINLEICCFTLALCTGCIPTEIICEHLDKTFANIGPPTKFERLPHHQCCSTQRQNQFQDGIHGELKKQTREPEMVLVAS